MPQVVEVSDGYQGDLGTIEINDLSFKYENEVILDKINMVIKPGEIVGIEGRSGSGREQRY